MHVRKFLRSVGRAVKLTLIFLFSAIGLAIRRPATRSKRAEWLQAFCARLLRTMGIAVSVEGTFPKSGVVVSNHMGYLDIVGFAAQGRCVFLAAAELAKVPLLGWMATMAGTIYVERGSGGSAVRARASLLAAAEDGIPIVIFPEGTTTDGTTMLPFRSGALAQVMQAGLPVTAAFVRYRLSEDNGAGVSVQNDVAYWGDEVQLFPHIFGLLGLRGVELLIRIADQPIAFSAPDLERKQAAQEARAAVMQLGQMHSLAPAGD